MPRYGFGATPTRGTDEVDPVGVTDGGERLRFYRSGE